MRNMSFEELYKFIDMHVTSGTFVNKEYNILYI